jgi:hypothetical protein
MAITSMTLVIGEAVVVGGSINISLQKGAALVVQKATVCGQAACTCNMVVGMQREHENLTWTWTYSMDIEMQPGYGHAA